MRLDKNVGKLAMGDEPVGDQKQTGAEEVYNPIAKNGSKEVGGKTYNHKKQEGKKGRKGDENWGKGVLRGDKSWGGEVVSLWGERSKRAGRGPRRGKERKPVADVGCRGRPGKKRPSGLRVKKCLYCCLSARRLRAGGMFWRYCYGRAKGGMSVLFVWGEKNSRMV